MTDGTGHPLGTQPTGHRLLARRNLLVLVAALLAVAGTISLVVALNSQHHPPRPSKLAQNAPLPTASTSAAPRSSADRRTSAPPAPTASTASRAALAPARSGLRLSSSQPIRLSVPAIGVSTTIMNLGLNPDSTVQTPPLSRNSVAGWYEFSPAPGANGASVILGHVDSAQYGPAVFFRLGALQPGDEVDVARQDGSTAVFRVDRVAEYPKSQFPTSLVYGSTDYAALRLVTCGGSFDAATGNYRDNIIAFTSLVSSRRT